MREGVMTEREWRKQSRHTPRRVPRCWGPQCMLPIIERTPHPYPKYRRYAARLLVMMSMGIAVGFWLLINAPSAEYPIIPALSESIVSLPMGRTVRANSAVSYRIPDLPLKPVIFSRSELLCGKMMRIDAEHPLPSDAPMPDPVCIATYGRGMVPVCDLTLKSGTQTIEALEELFADARRKGVEGLTVWRASMSEAEQRELQLERVRVHAATMNLDEAVAKAREEVDDPNTSDFQQEYTVDIRLCTTPGSMADNRPHRLTQQGRYLLQNAWRYGFVRRYPYEDTNLFREYQFRYVGVAHSTTMTYLDLDIESYLDLLHEKKAIQVNLNGTPRYVILCQPLMEEYVSVSLPDGCEYEASYDNMGYVIVACTLP